MNLGPHAAFVWTCYGVTALAIAGLGLWLIADARRLAARLASLEARGIVRRSAQPAGEAP